MDDCYCHYVPFRGKRKLVMALNGVFEFIGTHSTWQLDVINGWARAGLNLIESGFVLSGLTQACPKVAFGLCGLAKATELSGT